MKWGEGKREEDTLTSKGSRQDQGRACTLPSEESAICITGSKTAER
jgi:hypothetical protein